MPQKTIGCYFFGKISYKEYAQKMLQAWKTFIREDINDI